MHAKMDILGTISSTVQFHSEWYVDSELKFVDDFHSSLRKSIKQKQSRQHFLVCCRNHCDDDFLQSGQWLVKITEICLSLFIIFVSPFNNGFYGENGLSIALAAASLAISIAFALLKLRTLHRWATPRHWFIVESLTYGLISIVLLLCAIATIFVIIYRHMVQTEVEAMLLQWHAIPLTDLLLISITTAVALFLCSIAYLVDIWLVYRQRHWRTWIMDKSEYKI